MTDSYSIEDQLDPPVTGESLASDLLGGSGTDGKALSFASRRIAETAFHDFSQYVYLGDPYALARDDLEGVPDQAVIAYERFVEEFLPVIYRSICEFVPDRITIGDYGSFSRNNGPYSSYNDQNLALHWHELFSVHTAPRLYAIYESVERPTAWFTACLRALFEWLEYAAGDYEVQYMSTPEFWEMTQDRVVNRAQQSMGDEDGGNDRYRFVPYPSPSVNFGLRLIYRQTWTPLGTQPGEIVRTLPLGPKQAERVSVKFVRRTKEARSVETLVSQETVRETSETTKDSSEVIAEASKSFNWHVEAEASVTYGMFSASLSAGMGGESASSSKDTKTRLNETMEKTTSKMRNETKVVVSTEREETFEQATSSEITNPNEEIAITYVYSRLQRQYEIATRLAEVSSVVFVSEEIPDKVTAEWVRRHDWIIAKVLLDESFGPDLAAVRAYRSEAVVSEGTADDAFVDAKIGGLMNSLATPNSSSTSSSPSALSGYSGYADIFRAPQEGYERELERSRARKKENAEYTYRENRLLQHIRDNILHYCRAIWSAEDPQQRLLRYYDVLVPVRWDFISTGAEVDGFIPGFYRPVINDSATDLVRLSDIINPAGPIGFVGNYAAFYVRASTRWPYLNNALRHLRYPYLRYDIRFWKVAGPGSIVYVAMHPDRLSPGDFRLVANGGQLELYSYEANGTAVLIGTSLLPVGQPRTVEIGPLRLVIADGVSTGSDFSISVISSPFLDDPELKVFRWEYPLPAPSDEMTVFSRDVIDDMGALVPQVESLLLTEALPTPSWGQLRGETRDAIRENYHNYLHAKEHTRRFLLETNNLLLDLDIGLTPALEDFKRLHRYVDVLKTAEDRERQRLDNVRRRALLSAKRYADPDIERVTVLSGGNSLTLAEVDGAPAPGES